MTPADPRDAEIFAEALRLSPEERAAFLVRACAGDDALRRRVEELLRVQVRVGDFLERTNPESGFSIAEAVAEAEGTRVGRYRLLEKLGEGGCGVVYLAEQDEPLKRQVAVKIIKPGMDTQAVIARFEAERQALALMDHPGIAKVFDAGQTASGRPYFVMELIRGVKITDYCDQHALSTDERLKLFVQVCHAIQHAHQKGVIHRDIKPSNILVTTTTDGAAQPVVIDFGIAKATIGGHLTDKTLFTAVDMLIGTPTYMSPEQTTASRADVDTRADIYSLGVLLYELLTGTTPFDAGELLQLGIDEVRRAIREREPLSPSARLSKMTADNLTTVARKRRAQPPALVRSVQGDLDWIAMKALEKDPSRRYDTANGLALDVGRFLSQEPVLARPASALYRFRKTVARNKAAFAGLAAVMAVLLGGLIVVSFGLARERQARADADHARAQEEAARVQAEVARQQADKDRKASELEAARSRQITRFLGEMLQGVAPSVSKGRDTALLREILDQAALRVDKELADQPEIRAELQRRIGTVYEELGLFDQAIELYRGAIAVYRQDPNGEDNLAQGLIVLGRSLVRRGKPAEAEAVNREALEIRRKLYGPEHPEVAAALNLLAGPLHYTGKSVEAEALIREGLAMRRKFLPADHPDIGESLLSLTNVVSYNDPTRDGEIEALQREVLAILRKHHGPQDPRIASALWSLGWTLRKQYKLAEAEALQRECLAMRRSLFGDVHPDISKSLVELADGIVAQGRLAEAEDYYREALAISLKGPGKEHRDIIPVLFGLARMLELRGKFTEAEATHRELLDLGQKILGEQHPTTSVLVGTFSGMLTTQGRFADAEKLLAEFPAPGFLEKPSSNNYLKIRANYAARRSRWSPAIEDLELVLKRNPKEHDSYMPLSTLFLAAGRRDDYASLRSKILQEYSGTASAVGAARLVITSLMQPLTDAELGLAARMVDTAARSRMEGNGGMNVAFARALFEHRRGSPGAAMEWSRKAAASPRPDLRGMSLAVQAMAHFNLQQPDQARATLAALKEYMAARLPQPGDDDLGAEWKDFVFADVGSEWKYWVFSRILFAEAKALIEDAPAAKQAIFP